MSTQFLELCAVKYVLRNITESCFSLFYNYTPQVMINIQSPVNLAINGKILLIVKHSVAKYRITNCNEAFICCIKLNAYGLSKITGHTIWMVSYTYFICSEIVSCLILFHE